MAVAEKNEVALIAPPRLPYHPTIEDRFGIDRASWRALIDAVYPAAKSTDAVILALSYCKARKLDPFKRPVHIVPVWDNDKREYVETVWPGIAEHRTTAFRTKQYAGAEAAVFGPVVEKIFTGETKKGRVNATVKFAEWAQLTVFRMIDGQRVPMPGPRVYWLETYSRLGRTEVPNDRWQRAPFQMLEKCAEAAALRRAFPEEIGDEPVAEEAGIYSREGDDAKDVTPAKPTRAEFVQREVDPAVAGHEDLDERFRQTVAHDTDTGEISDTSAPSVSQPEKPAEATQATPQAEGAGAAADEYDAGREFDALWEGALAEQTSGAVKAYWELQIEPGAAAAVLKKRAPDLYQDLFNKISTRVRVLKNERPA